MKSLHYILDGNGVPVIEDDIFKWGAWWSTNHERCVVGQTKLLSGATVSTVFLATDHNWKSYGDPLLYETMVFDADHSVWDGYMQRYSTLEQAVIGHMGVIRDMEPEHVWIGTWSQIADKLLVEHDELWKALSDL